MVEFDSENRGVLPAFIMKDCTDKRITVGDARSLLPAPPGFGVLSSEPVETGVLEVVGAGVLELLLKVVCAGVLELLLEVVGAGVLELLLEVVGAGVLELLTEAEETTSIMTLLIASRRDASAREIVSSIEAPSILTNNLHEFADTLQILSADNQRQWFPFLLLTCRKDWVSTPFGCDEGQRSDR